jgi:hypothetical protein
LSTLINLSDNTRQYGECSRMVELRRNSDEEVLHKQLVFPSNPWKGNICKRYFEKYVHSKEAINFFPLINCLRIHVLPVEVVTIIWRNFKEDNMCKKIHPRRKLKLKFTSQRKGKGGMTRRYHGSKMGTRHSTLIVVRVDIISRSVCYEKYYPTYKRISPLDQDPFFGPNI